MRWEWTDEGDDKVFKMWHLMKELSGRREVVYSKWFQNRATFFSRELFTALLALAEQKSQAPKGKMKEILETLEMDSPLSTKELKRMTDLQGKLNEAEYSRCMKQLFTRFQIVACGEVEDGAFPSLAVGATRHIYEDLWIAAKDMSPKKAFVVVDQWMPKGSDFRKFFERTIELKNLNELSD